MVLRIIAEKYAIKDTLTDADYHESAKALATEFENIKAKLIRYDALKEEYDLEVYHSGSIDT